MKDGRRIDAKHVKRKQLSSYLPPNVLQRTKRLVYTLLLYTCSVCFIIIFNREECLYRHLLAICPTEVARPPQSGRLLFLERGPPMRHLMP